MGRAGFDQNRRDHQDWLMATLHPQGLNGFYEAQDIADLLQGRPHAELAATIAGYITNRRELRPQEFLARLSAEKVRRGTAAPDWEWDAIEEQVRLRHWAAPA